jgi:outer membrane cobalamin receptor
MMRRAVMFALLLHLAPAPEARAQVAAELRGRVTDAANGRAVSGADVEVVERGVHARSASDGSFELRGLEPRTYHLRTRALGFTVDERDVDVENGRATTVFIELRTSARTLAPVVVDAAAEERLVAGGATFDRTAIERSGSRDVGDVLERAPSVVVTRSGGPGSPAYASIRGSSSNEVLVLVDGVPVNGSLGGSADLSRIPSETIERVTVLPGAQSARYGSRAMAGVILVETRRARREYSGAASAGAWGERAASAAVGEVTSVGRARWGGSLALQRRTATGDFTYDVPAVRGGGRAERHNADVASTSGVAATSLEVGRSASTLHANWEATERGVAGSIVQPSMTGRSDERRTSGGLDSRIAFGNVTIGASADLTDERSHFADPAPPFGGRYDDIVEDRSTRGTATATWAASIATLGTGVETQWTRMDATALDSAPPSQRTVGAWANARRTRALGATRVNVAATVRGDWDSLLPDASVSPRFVVAMERGPGSIAASVGSGFSPPSLADRFFHEGVLVRANPVLAPERVRGEVELRAALHDLAAGPFVVAADAAAYRADIDGMILWMPDFRFVWSPSNFDVHRRGWEASARAGLPSAGLAIHAVINDTRVEYAGPVLDGQVAYRPRTTGSASVEVSQLGVRASIMTRYVGERRTVPGSSLNLLDPYWLTDASLAVPVARGALSADVTVGLTNIFDRPAAMLVDYPFGGRGWTIGVRLRRAAESAFRS